MRREPADWSFGLSRYRWEDHGPVAVVSLLPPANENVRTLVCRSVQRLVDEFQLPVPVQMGPPGKDDLGLVQQMVASCTAGSLLDADRCRDTLREARAGGKLLQGLVILLDAGKYARIAFKDEKPQEPALYGYSIPDGLSLLLNYDEPAVRHEVGHMLGLPLHCQDGACVMHYRCPRPGLFCTSCKMTLVDLWH
ncbi:MAG: hypothetical protein HY684_02065 [Chloroflexi bacterium]|nr:hypothetical protein [Chloroflexota bacterium]